MKNLAHQAKILRQKLQIINVIINYFYIFFSKKKKASSGSKKTRTLLHLDNFFGEDKESENKRIEVYSSGIQGESRKKRTAKLLTI